MQGKSLTLWARAPIWRFTVYSALLSSLLLVVLPLSSPTANPQGATPSPLPDASYQPPPDTVAAAPLQMDQADPTAQSAVVPSEPQALAANSGAAVTAGTTPATASLSMAVPGQAAAGNTGMDQGLVGRLYASSISVEGFTVPLPPGQWAMLATTGMHGTGASGVVYFLGRIVKKQLVGAVWVTAARSQQLPGEGYTVNGCDSNAVQRIFYVYTDGMIPKDHQSCVTIYNIFTAPWQQWGDRAVHISNTFRAAAGDMAAKGVSYPQDFVVARLARAEKWGFLDIDYLFSPDAEGIKSSSALSIFDSDWTASNIERFPDKVAYANRIKKWAGDEWPQIQSAFVAGQPSGAAASRPIGYLPSGNANPAPVSSDVGTATDGRTIDVSYNGPLNLPGFLNLTAGDVRKLLRNANFVDSEESDDARRNVRINQSDIATRFLFDSGGRMRTIRLYPAYQGDVAGVHFGDDQEQVKHFLGEPVRPPFTYGHTVAYVYRPEGSYVTRFDINQSGKVEDIFLQR